MKRKVIDVDNDNEAKKGLRLKAGCWSRFSNRPLRFHNYLGSRKRNSLLTSVWCFCYGITGETAKSVKSLGLKDNTTNQIRMKIYSVHIQTAWVETKTVKE